MTPIDLRSDTVTLPSPVMREAIGRAELGDDVYGEDPTVNRLQEMAAARLNKEAALLLPSGTMANLVAVLAHCGRGDEAIMGGTSHLFLDEAGNISALGGVVIHTLPSVRGMLAPERVAAAVRPNHIRHPRSRLVCLENAHNHDGGVVLTAAQTRAVADVAHANGLALHIDGARLFNAAVALGVTAGELAREADSVAFCLSKGLACPMGSLLVGESGFIDEARRQRKLIGGAMRQAGIFAAAGIVALDTMVDRLADDHANARRLAEGIAALPGLAVDLETVQTNFVVFAVEAPGMTTAKVSAALRELGVLINPFDRHTMRAVTHYGIEAGDVDVAIAALRDVMATRG